MCIKSMQCEVSLNTTTKRINLNWRCEYLIQRQTWAEINLKWYKVTQKVNNSTKKLGALSKWMPNFPTIIADSHPCQGHILLIKATSSFLLGWFLTAFYANKVIISASIR